MPIPSQYFKSTEVFGLYGTTAHSPHHAAVRKSEKVENVLTARGIVDFAKMDSLDSQISCCQRYVCTTKENQFTFARIYLYEQNDRPNAKSTTQGEIKRPTLDSTYRALHII